MSRKLYYWKLPSVDLQLGERTLLMGILNITPDSFSDGGLFNNPERAYARALEMEEQGADIIDLGAESTRPDSARISADEEWRRLLPVLKLLKDKITVPLSLDTYKSEIAERALQFGVRIINDPSGLTFDPAVGKVASDAGVGLVLNHMRGLPESWANLPPMPDVAGTIARDLDATTNRARRAGVDKSRIVIDPGLGFGKRREQNAEIIAQLGRLAELGYPILVGPSRKSFLKQAAGEDTSFPTAAAVTASILNGAHIVRVHDVKEMCAVSQIADEIARAAAAVPKPEEKPQERPVPRKRAGDFRAPDDDRPRPPRPPLAAPPPPPPPPSDSGTAPFYARRERREDDRPPRGDFRPGRGGDRPARTGDRPPRGEFRPARSGERPSRGDFRPARSDDRPPRRGPSDRGGSSDRGGAGRGPGRGGPSRGPSKGPWRDKPPGPRRSDGPAGRSDAPGPKGKAREGDRPRPPRPFRKRP